MASEVQAGDWITGPFWQGRVQVISLHPNTGYDAVTVHSTDVNDSRTYVMTPDDWAMVERATPADHGRADFSGDAFRFRLGIRAHLLRLAHSVDPYAALNASRIDPLPHQFEAVYEHLLARPIVRALLAHDAGAGKTIMAGMVIKELRRRQGARRVLIVTPAGLTAQWRRELLTKFAEDFTQVSRAYMGQAGLDILDVWRRTDSVITSMDFAKQKSVRRALESVEWDLVIVDEGHKMAAYARPDGRTEKTQAYQLGEVLTRHTTHFLMMTATPHKGDPDNYRLLISLLDPQWAQAAAYTSGSNPLVLRRTKEEMLKPNGDPLYPERIVETVPYNLSPREGQLLEQTQEFIGQRYKLATNAKKQSAAFALITLGRRMASSPYALRESLDRIRTKTQDRLNNVRTEQADNEDSQDGSEWEELTEAERWQREAQAEAEVATLVSYKQLQAEIRQLDGLISSADAVVKQGAQEKLTELKKACDLWVGTQGNQLIVFTEFKDTLDYLLKNIGEWGYTTTQIHGGMPMEERRKAERAFWRADAQVLVATEAAGEGINLQCASVMLNFDIPWNPARLEQRMGRIHRYGQRADKVYIFNLLARNSMEDEVKAALLNKLKEMKKDLGDKVFDVVGQVLWDSALRDILQRAVLGDVAAVRAAESYLDEAEQAARRAIEAENDATATSQPLDIASFQRKQATFPAHRLSPETAEKFFRQALPFLGGAVQEHVNRGSNGIERAVFEVVLPSGLGRRQRRKLVVSFWSEVCSDDELEDNVVQFISPGHWLFEALLDAVIERCGPDLNKGAVFCDLNPKGHSPYLTWFVHTHVRTGLNQQVSDFMAAVQHEADAERVTRLPLEVLEGFDFGKGEDVSTATRQVSPMLAGQAEVVNQCLSDYFLGELAALRARHKDALEQDRTFLTKGLTAMAEHFSTAALDAYSEGKIEEGERFTDQSEAARERLAAIQAQMAKAEHLLMVAPEVLGVALVVPTPIKIGVGKEQSGSQGDGPRMHQDKEVEMAAMNIVMAYEEGQGRKPRDVHQGNSWDIESDSPHGSLLRYIEVKGRGPEDADEVWLTEPEWDAAQRLGDMYWLYIVRLGDKMMWMIQNPYAKLKPKELKRWIVPIAQVAPLAIVERVEITSTSVDSQQ